MKLDNQGKTQYDADVGHTQRDYNSIVFNAFIFCQVGGLSYSLLHVHSKVFSIKLCVLLHIDLQANAPFLGQWQKHERKGMSVHCHAVITY